MKPRRLFATHLYNQIVIPLLAASIVIGLAAGLVSTYFLADITDRWVTQVADSAANDFATRYAGHGQYLRRITRLAGMTSDIEEAARLGDPDRLTSVVSSARVALDVDCLMLVDGSGRTVCVAGRRGPGVGEIIGDFASDAFAGDTPALITLGDAPAIGAAKSVEGTGLTLIAADYVDDSLLMQLGVEPETGYAYYDANRRRIATAIDPGTPTEVAAEVDRLLSEPAPAVTAAIGQAATDGHGAATVSVDGLDYHVFARRLSLGGEELGRFGYVVSAVSHADSREAGRTTTNFVTMWSIVAVVSLVGLGGWVARRVSDPLVVLADGARRIADGDFSTKVDVKGSNEVAELASTFNQMTDSLRERSDSLTKKMLELATLYEMSRALGSTLDMEELLGSVLESALRIFDLDVGYVSLRDPVSGSLSIRAIRGPIEGADGETAMRSSMSEWVVREGRPLIFNPEAGSAGQIDGLTGARAALCVPLVSTEGTIGAITIGSSDADYRFNSEDVRLLSTIANHVTIAIGNIELFTTLQEAYLATVRSLAAAVDAKDTYTRGHSERVAAYAILIAERMGIGHDQKVALEMAAYLHDIGKIGVPEDILLKPGCLTDEEMSQMRHHPLIGANILKPVAFPWAITPVVRHHHEHYDGTGYPAGLTGDEIPVLARILTAADSFEAMTADRPYRRGRSTAEAIEELRRCAGTQFDPRVVDAFVDALDDARHSDSPGKSVSDAEEISAEESRAIFAAIIDGLFVSFRRLGGPRLASNVEREADHAFVEQGAPFRIKRGRLSFIAEPPASPHHEVETMRAAIRHVEAIMTRLSGATLVDHFHEDALDGLSMRMRELAGRLGFSDKV